MFPPDGAGRRNPVRVSVESSREPLAALEPPGLEYCPSRPCGHPSPKAVLGGSVLLVGLIGAFHDRLLRTRFHPSWARQSGLRLDSSQMAGWAHRVRNNQMSGAQQASAGRLGVFGGKGQLQRPTRLAEAYPQPARVSHSQTSSGPVDVLWGGEFGSDTAMTPVRGNRRDQIPATTTPRMSTSCGHGCGQEM